MDKKKKHPFHKMVVFAFIAIMMYIVLQGYYQRVREVANEPSELYNTEQESAILNIYSSYDEDQLKPLLDQFTNETGIIINYSFDKAPTLLDKYKQEEARAPADIFFAENIIDLMPPLSESLFQSFSSPAIQQNINQPYYDPAWRWYSVSKNILSIFYAKNRVTSDEVTSYRDLSNNKWQGRLLLPSSQNKDIQALVTLMVDRYGVENTSEWVYKLVRNLETPPFADNLECLKAIALGKGDITIAPIADYIKLINSNNPEDKALVSKLGFFVPEANENKAFFSAIGIAMFRNALHKKSGIKLTEFLLRNDIQQYIASKNNQLPIIEKTPVPQKLSKFKDIEIDKRSLRSLENHSEDAQSILYQQGWQ